MEMPEKKGEAGSLAEGEAGKSEESGNEQEQMNPVTEAEEEKEENKGLRPDVATEDAKEEEGEEEGEEGREAIAMPSPLSPSRQEKEHHELTHTPYRAWCPHCVRARGRNRAHKTSADHDKSSVPKIAFDYFFFSDEEEKANKNPMIVMVDESTGEKYARGVEQKGLDSDGEVDWLISGLAKELKSWGYHGGEHGHLIFKSDGEASIRLIRDKLARQHGGNVAMGNQHKESLRAMTQWKKQATLCVSLSGSSKTTWRQRSEPIFMARIQ